MSDRWLFCRIIETDTEAMFEWTAGHLPIHRPELGSCQENIPAREAYGWRLSSRERVHATRAVESAVYEG